MEKQALCPETSSSLTPASPWLEVTVGSGTTPSMCSGSPQGFPCPPQAHFICQQLLSGIGRSTITREMF